MKLINNFRNRKGSWIYVIIRGTYSHYFRALTYQRRHDFSHIWWCQSLMENVIFLRKKNPTPQFCPYISNSFSFWNTSKNSHFFELCPPQTDFFYVAKSPWSVYYLLHFIYQKTKDDEFKYMLFYPIDT